LPPLQVISHKSYRHDQEVNRPNPHGAGNVRISTPEELNNLLKKFKNYDLQVDQALPSSRIPFNRDHF